MSSSRRYSSSGDSHDKFNSDTYGRPYSPLLQSQQHIRSPPSSIPERSPSPFNSATKRNSFYNSSSSQYQSRSSKVSNTTANLLGFSPTQVPVQPVHHRRASGPGGGGVAGSFFLPPAAVTSFAYGQTKSLYDMQRSPLYTLQQQVKALTAELQELLDAQSTGLLMASGHNTQVGSDGTASGKKEMSKGGRSGWDGGVTSSVMTDRSRGNKISLTAARQGIIRAMYALAEVKGMEEEAYVAEETERQRNISQVQGWENKKMELEQGIKEVEEGEEARRVVEFRKEREAVELEIRKVEAQLASLKSHHSNLLSKISTLESTLSNRSSSYRQSLSSISTLQTRFLSKLPANLRNISISVEHWKVEADALREKKEQARMEREALREGVIEWEEALALVRGFEENLKREVVASTMSSSSAGIDGSHATFLKHNDSKRNSPRSFGAGTAMARSPRDYSSPSTFLGNRNKLSPTSSGPFSPARKPSLHRFDSLLSSSPDDGQVPDDLYPRSSPKTKTKTDNQRVKSQTSTLDTIILKAIEEVLIKLEEKVQHAENKNWNLLVCCLAAEAQAFREAREIMHQKIYNSGATPSEGYSKPKSSHKAERNEPFGDIDEGVDLKSKFGRMEIGSMKMTGGKHVEKQRSRLFDPHGLGSGHADEGGLVRGASGGLDDDELETTQNWGDIQNFGGVGLIGADTEEETKLFELDMDGTEMTPMQRQGSHSQSQNQSQSNSQQGGSSSVSPKTPSRKGSHSSRNRRMNRAAGDSGIAGIDGSGSGGVWDRRRDFDGYNPDNGGSGAVWDRRGRDIDGYNPDNGGDEEDDDNATVRGSVQLFSF